MTYPVDDAGNPRVDFVWGNMAMQPNDQREDAWINIIDSNGDQNRGWTGSWAHKSSNLNTTETVPLSLGDQSYDDEWRSPDTRTVTIDADSHNIATTGWSNYPQFLPNYAGDGDTGLELVLPELSGNISQINNTLENLGLVLSVVNDYVGATLDNNDSFKSQSPAGGTIVNPSSTVTVHWYSAPQVPNLAGLTEAAATTALTNAHLTKGAVTTADNAAGATALNDGNIKTQSIASGTTVDTGTAVALVKYAYTAVPNPIAGFSVDSFPGHSALTGQEVYMFLLGRTVKPTSLSTILISGNSNSSLNRNWTVNTVEDNDSYNTGGTVCELTAQGVESVDNPNTNVTVGTWFQL